MSYDEEQQKRSRVVVETPNARREEYYARTSRAPERARPSAASDGRLQEDCAMLACRIRGLSSPSGA